MEYKLYKQVLVGYGWVTHHRKQWVRYAYWTYVVIRDSFVHCWVGRMQGCFSFTNTAATEADPGAG